MVSIWSPKTGKAVEGPFTLRLKLDKIYDKSHTLRLYYNNDLISNHPLSDAIKITTLPFPLGTKFDVRVALFRGEKFVVSSESIHLAYDRLSQLPAKQAPEKHQEEPKVAVLTNPVETEKMTGSFQLSEDDELEKLRFISNS